MKRIDTHANDIAVDQLRTSRGTLGLTQKELAGIVGLSKQQVVDYENFRATVPGGLILQVQKIMKAKSKQPTTTRRKGDRRKVA